MDRFGVILFVGISTIVVLGFVLSRWLEKRRTDAWRRVAETLGLSFLGTHTILLNRCSGFKVFDQGTSQRFYNVIEADADNVRITVGDFSYRTHTSSSSRSTKSKRHVQTVCVLENGDLDTPHCYLRPQLAIFDKLGALFGGQDINFVDDPAFSGAYVLQGDHEPAVRALFDAQVRSWFTNHRSERFQFETRGNLIVFHYGKTRKPEDVQQFMQQALEVMKLLTHG